MSETVLQCVACGDDIPADSPTFARTDADLTFPSGTLEEARQVLKTVRKRNPHGTPGVRVKCTDEQGTSRYHGHHVDCLLKMTSQTWSASHNKCMYCMRAICDPQPNPPGLPADIDVPMPNPSSARRSEAFDAALGAAEFQLQRSRQNFHSPDTLATDERNLRTLNRSVNKRARAEMNRRDREGIRQTRASTTMYRTPRLTRHDPTRRRQYIPEGWYSMGEDVVMYDSGSINRPADYYPGLGGGGSTDASRRRYAVIGSCLAIVGAVAFM